MGKGIGRERERETGRGLLCPSSWRSCKVEGRWERVVLVRGREGGVEGNEERKGGGDDHLWRGLCGGRSLWRGLLCLNKLESETLGRGRVILLVGKGNGDREGNGDGDGDGEGKVKGKGRGRGKERIAVEGDCCA